MRNSKTTALWAIGIMMIVAVISTIAYNIAHEPDVVSSYSGVLEQAPAEEYPLIGIEEDFTINDEFTSHLPIVVIDTNGEVIQEPSSQELTLHVDEYGQTLETSFLSTEYVNGQISIYNSGDGSNSIDDTPAETSNMIIKKRGNTSLFFEKGQYMVKLQTESGQNNAIDILGMGAHHEWILSATMIDKSMLRNYLAFSTASQILEYTPDAKYCEVVIKDGETYQYQGLYMMLESISQDENRVNIEEYAQTRSYNSYLLRRDRYNETDTMLDTFGRKNGYALESIGVEYPTKTTITEETVAYIEEELEIVEKVLYSDDINVFSTYSNYIDVDSFVDYFLINEFFMNYDAGNHSTYFYKDSTGKLTMGPVWDFDGAMGNYFLEPVNVADIAFQTKPWFDMLCRDDVFVGKLMQRYNELRRTILAEDTIIGKIDEIEAHLGGAIDREWYRWSEYHTAEDVYYGVGIEGLRPYVDEEGDELKRSTLTYEEELYQIKTILRQHGNEILGNLEKLQGATTMTTGARNYRDWALLMVLLAFFVPSVYIYYRK